MKIRHIAIGSVILALAACASNIEDDGLGPGAAYCDAYCACTNCSTSDLNDCNAEIDDFSSEASKKTCRDQFGTYLDCLESLKCEEEEIDTSVCDAEFNALGKCLNPGSACATAKDSVCDEPEGTGKCAEGTDAADCALPACATAGNGVCDEPEGTATCAEGSDAADCKLPCETTNDLTCDEPEGTATCPEGTDGADCGGTTCLYTNNGVCDESEGTGLCGDDTDASDCTLNCTTYCSTMLESCFSPYQQYPTTASCTKVCGTLKKGTTSDSSGNTLGCRMYYASYAVSDSFYCEYAGPGGNDACGTACESFCSIAQSICTGASAQYVSMDACMTDCAKFPQTEPYDTSDTVGNTYACRLYHLMAASETPATHCPHIVSTSTVCK